MSVNFIKAWKNDKWYNKRVLIWRFTLVLIKINYGQIGDQTGLFYTRNPVFYTSGKRFVRRTGTFGNLWFIHLSRRTTVIQDLLVWQFSLVPDNRTNVNVEAWRGVLDTTLCDKVCLTVICGRSVYILWFYAILNKWKHSYINKMNCELMLTYDTPALRQTGSRNMTGPKTLPTIWGTYMKLVTKYQISAINSCWEKCDEKCAYMLTESANRK